MSTLIVFSHLRWNFVFQRPQHLMTRFARTHRVVIWEEPQVGGSDAPRLAVRAGGDGIRVATPHLPAGLDAEATDSALKQLLES